MMAGEDLPTQTYAQARLCVEIHGSSSQRVREALHPQLATTMPGLSLPGISTGPGKPIRASRIGAGINWPGLSNVFYGKSTSGLQRLCSSTIFFPF